MLFNDADDSVIDIDGDDAAKQLDLRTYEFFLD